MVNIIILIGVGTAGLAAAQSMDALIYGYQYKRLNKQQEELTTFFKSMEPLRMQAYSNPTLPGELEIAAKVNAFIEKLDMLENCPDIGVARDSKLRMSLPQIAGSLGATFAVLSAIHFIQAKKTEASLGELPYEPWPWDQAHSDAFWEYWEKTENIQRLKDIAVKAGVGALVSGTAAAIFSMMKMEKTLTRTKLKKEVEAFLKLLPTRENKIKFALVRVYRGDSERYQNVLFCQKDHDREY